MAKFLYWLPDHGMTRADAREVDSECRHPKDVAGDAARHFHYRGNGLDVLWPIKITVEMQNGNEHTFEVDRQMEPMFFALEVVTSQLGKGAGQP